MNNTEPKYRQLIALLENCNSSLEYLEDVVEDLCHSQLLFALTEEALQNFCAEIEQVKSGLNDINNKVLENTV